MTLDQAAAMEAIGKTMKAIRTERGLSQQQAAELAGVSREALSSIECACRFPRFDTFLVLCHAYGITPGEAMKEVKL